MEAILSRGDMSFNAWLAKQLQQSDIYLYFDRYFDFSTNNSTREISTQIRLKHHWEVEKLRVYPVRVLGLISNDKGYHWLL